MKIMQICVQQLQKILDDAKNNTRSDAIDISKDGAKVRTLVIATNEELMIAKETLELVSK